MKYFLLKIILLYTFINSCPAQSPNLNIADTASHIMLQPSPSSPPGFFITQVELPQLTHAAFLSIAVYSYRKYSGDISYKIANGDWTPLHRYHEATHPDREIFELLTLPIGVRNIQIRTDRTIRDYFLLRWFAPAAGQHHASLSAAPRDECDCPQPEICGRACWCPSGDCPQDATPTATAPSHIIVHHSAAHSASNDFAAVVRSYWDFHVNVNGWDDIGYNWLVDGDGVIYKGRGSGVRGAHFSCMNAETTGICMIGNFETATPTQAALSSLENLITWESCDKAIIPQDSSIHVTAQVPLAHISGHRDGNDLPNSCTNTACPGANLYPLLPTIRTQVAEQACLQVTTNTTTVLENNITLFPNPNNGNFFITKNELAIKTIEVRSANGALLSVFDKNDNSINEINTSVIPLSIEAPGVYFVQIGLEDGGVITRWVVVER